VQKPEAACYRGQTWQELQGRAGSPLGRLWLSAICLFDLPLTGLTAPLAAVMGSSVFGQALVTPTEVWAWSGGGWSLGTKP
jgi:hypothetical protein